MVEEVCRYLSLGAGGRWVDATLGEGGHAQALLDGSAPDGCVLGIDRDADAIASAVAHLGDTGGRLRTVQAELGELLSVLEDAGWSDGADGVLVDLGVSSLQLRTPERGFSFAADGPLDMRMDRSVGPTAADLLNSLSERDLAAVIRRFGEEPAARRIARVVVEKRRARPLARTGDLRAAVRAAGVRGKPGHDPATRTFQALRIAVNGELDQLAALMDDGWRAMRPGGRMVVLSYHSLEDRLVKAGLRRWAADCLCPPRQPICNCGWSAKVDLVLKRKLRPTAEEIARNPSARSAGLRVVERRTDPPERAS
jgi:16S rRNA (cytosine1402-N4)-methyltransferase